MPEMSWLPRAGRRVGNSEKHILKSSGHPRPPLAFSLCVSVSVCVCLCLPSLDAIRVSCRSRQLFGSGAGAGRDFGIYCATKKLQPNCQLLHLNEHVIVWWVGRVERNLFSLSGIGELNGFEIFGHCFCIRLMRIERNWHAWRVRGCGEGKFWMLLAFWPCLSFDRMQIVDNWLRSSRVGASVAGFCFIGTTSMQSSSFFNFGFFSFMVLRAMENLKLWGWELGVDSWGEVCEPVAVFWLILFGMFVPAFDRHKLYLYPSVLAWPRLCRFQPQFCRHAFPACL